MLDANRDISIKLAGARAQKKCLKIKFYAIKLKSMRQAEKISSWNCNIAGPKISK